MNLTLTSVVFEFFMPFTSTTSSIHLTLTIVVFEFGDIKSRYLVLYLTLTSVVQKNKSYNKENFSMLQLFLLIL